ncbi:MAG: hypothetical protein ABSF56_01420 [Minisyncoccia bacterium]|jgi:hypothetical protein
MKTAAPNDNTKDKKAHGPAAPRESLAHKISRDPFLDWLFILTATLLIALSLVVEGLYVYLDTEARLSSTRPLSTRTARTAIDTNALQQVLDRFDDRAAERAALVKGYSAPKDPSLP